MSKGNSIASTETRPDSNGTKHVRINDKKLGASQMSRPGEGGHVNQLEKGVQRSHPESGVHKEGSEKAALESALREGLEVGSVSPAHTRMTHSSPKNE